MKRLACLAVLWALLVPTAALGQTTVTVLGLQSASADEAIAANMTDALRLAAEAASSSGLEHTGRENELSQLFIVFDCEEPTPTCMREIGESLGSQRLVYGTVEPESGRSDADYAVNLSYFNVETGEVERDLREVIPRGITPDGMIEPASQFFTALTGTVVPGELAVRCNVSGAHVFIDDEEVGSTTDEPLVLRDLEPGEITLEVQHEDYPTHTQTIEIESGQTREIMVTLREGGGDDGGGGGGGEDGGRRSLAWLGWTSLGLSVVTFGLGLWGSLDVNAANDDDVIQGERQYWPDDVNICDEAEAGNVGLGSPNDANEIADRCGRAQTFQVLQFVFYGVSAVTFGVGLWLVLREYLGGDDEDEEQSGMRLRVDPVVFDGGGAVAASLTF